jgi:hypothetical protein
LCRSQSLSAANSESRPGILETVCPIILPKLDTDNTKQTTGNISAILKARRIAIVGSRHNEGENQMRKITDVQRSASFMATWRRLRQRIFDPYRPELHYMRGPGPKWREKHAHAI